MHSFLLQDWTTIRGGTATVTQQETDWLDLSLYQDAVFWVLISSSTNTPTLSLQTSPSEDDVFFQSMVTGIPMLSSATPTIAQALMMSTNTITPLARFVRWQITGTTTWDATFRIAVAANAPGLVAQP